jgi:signal peptidase I
MMYDPNALFKEREAMHTAHATESSPLHESVSVTPPPEKKENIFIETLRFVVISLIIVLPFRYFIAQPFVVSGASMDPTFANGEYLIVDQISYRFSEPKRGDVVIFRYPRDPSKFFIKRIIGLPGETVDLRDGEIRISATTSPSFTLSEPYIKTDAAEGQDHRTLSSTEYYVMGDNRSASSDSRSWGPLQRRLIVGKPILRLLPISHIDIHPGAIATN